jgi:hypothetical protein
MKKLWFCVTAALIMLMLLPAWQQTAADPIRQWNQPDLWREKDVGNFSVSLWTESLNNDLAMSFQPDFRQQWENLFIFTKNENAPWQNTFENTDYRHIALNWHHNSQETSAAAPVPEPTTGLLLAGGLVAMIPFRRRTNQRRE